MRYITVLLIIVGVVSCNEPLIDVKYLYDYNVTCNSPDSLLVPEKMSLELKNDNFSDYDIIYYNQVYKELKEPAAFCKNDSYEMIRVFQLNSFGESQLLKISKLEYSDSILVTTKKFPASYHFIKAAGAYNVNTGEYTVYSKRDDTLQYTQRIKSISEDQWEEILRKINLINLSYLKSESLKFGVDGTKILIEQHYKDGYFVAHEWITKEREKMCDDLLKYIDGL